MTDGTYAQGFLDGERNMQALWTEALIDLLPGDVDCYPAFVAAYIKQLQAGDHNDGSLGVRRW